MTEKSQRQDREDAREDRDTSSTEMSAEVAEERAAQNNLNVEMPSESGDTQGVTESPRPRARRTSRKAASTPEPVRAQEPLSVSPLEADAMELEAQGFSPDEAQRLIDMSKRLESSAEARASQAELKRLRFTQWLIEHGILDEFSV